MVKTRGDIFCKEEAFFFSSFVVYAHLEGLSACLPLLGGERPPPFSRERPPPRERSTRRPYQNRHVPTLPVDPKEKGGGGVGYVYNI